MKRGIICDICGTKFDSKVNNAKYCSDPCRKEGNKRKREAWKKRNPDYFKNASKEYRRKQKLIKEERRREHYEAIKRIIEQRTGGKGSRSYPPTNPSPLNILERNGRRREL